MKKKLTIIIISVIILAIIGGGVFWYLNKSEEIVIPEDEKREEVVEEDNNKILTKVGVDKKGWSIYQSEKYGFKISLPKKVTFLHVPEYERIHFYFDEKQRNEFEHLDNGEISLYYNRDATKLDWLKESAEKEDDILVSNIMAKKYINVKGGQDELFPTILFTNILINDKNFLISFKTDVYSFDEEKFIPTIEDKNIYNEILATIKFIND